MKKKPKPATWTMAEIRWAWDDCADTFALPWDHPSSFSVDLRNELRRIAARRKKKAKVRK